MTFMITDITLDKHTQLSIYIWSPQRPCINDFLDGNRRMNEAWYLTTQTRPLAEVKKLLHVTTLKSIGIRLITHEIQDIDVKSIRNPTHIPI